jgi:hypothetical protein
MYTIEIQNLNLQNAQGRVLGAIENLCDTFGLEEQFGVLSYGMHELVSLMERTFENQNDEFAINFYIQNDRVSVQVLAPKSLGDIARMLDTATFEDAETAAFIVSQLTDTRELRNDGRELWLDIMVTPTFPVADRAEILAHHTVKQLQ